MDEADLARVKLHMSIHGEVWKDVRVQAASAALDAFNVSEWGQRLDRANANPDRHWRERIGDVPDDVKDRYEAHSYNFYHTMRMVRDELLATRQA